MHTFNYEIVSAVFNCAESPAITILLALVRAIGVATNLPGLTQLAAVQLAQLQHVMSVGGTYCRLRPFRRCIHSRLRVKSCTQ